MSFVRNDDVKTRTSCEGYRWLLPILYLIEESRKHQAFTPRLEVFKAAFLQFDFGASLHLYIHTDCFIVATEYHSIKRDFIFIIFNDSTIFSFFRHQNIEYQRVNENVVTLKLTNFLGVSWLKEISLFFLSK